MPAGQGRRAQGGERLGRAGFMIGAGRKGTAGRGASISWKEMVTVAGVG